MSTYMLIHGSFQGSWTWTPVARKLQAAGHTVYHPSLAGCAERAPTLTADITLDVQASEIARLITFDDLKDVILVGTSTGGLVVARTAELVPERICRIVLIDALCPVPGETIAQVNNRPPWDPSLLTYGFEPEEVANKAFLGVEPAELRRWMLARYARQPRLPADGPVSFDKFWSTKWKANVLRCRQAKNPNEGHQRRNAERLGAKYEVVDSGHFPMLTHVDFTVDYLQRLDQ